MQAASEQHRGQLYDEIVDKVGGLWKSRVAMNGIKYQTIIY